MRLPAPLAGGRACMLLRSMQSLEPRMVGPRRMLVFCAVLCSFGERLLNRRSRRIVASIQVDFPVANSLVARLFPFVMLRRSRLSRLNGGLPVA